MRSARTSVLWPRRGTTHGLIGDLQTCALVSSEGVMDWFCSPRFDSPSVFAGLLDHGHGGYFAITAEAPQGVAGGGPGAEAGVVTRRLYLADTAVLITRFLTREGVGEVVDFMPVRDPHTATDRHQVVRVLRAVRGSVRFALECRPRFDYGRAPHELALDGAIARFEGPGITDLKSHGGARRVRSQKATVGLARSGAARPRDPRPRALPVSPQRMRGLRTTAPGTRRGPAPRPPGRRPRPPPRRCIRRDARAVRPAPARRGRWW